MKNTLHIQIPDALRKVAKIRAIEEGVTVSQYVGWLIEHDARRNSRGTQPDTARVAREG